MVLGVDPGTVRTGWGVVALEGPRLRGVAAGVVCVDERLPLEQRLAAIFDGLAAVIAAHAPDSAAVEDVFFAKYPAAALKLGHARGVALLAAARAGLSVTAYPPATVKRAVAGRGAADKAQIARMVTAILGFSTLPAVDATDALAVAITHANAARVQASPGRGYAAARGPQRAPRPAPGARPSPALPARGPR